MGKKKKERKKRKEEKNAPPGQFRPVTVRPTRKPGSNRGWKYVCVHTHRHTHTHTHSMHGDSTFIKCVDNAFPQ